MKSLPILCVRKIKIPFEKTIIYIFLFANAKHYLKVKFHNCFYILQDNLLQSLNESYTNIYSMRIQLHIHSVLKTCYSSKRFYFGFKKCLSHPSWSFVSKCKWKCKIFHKKKFMYSYKFHTWNCKIEGKV